MPQGSFFSFLLICVIKLMSVQHLLIIKTLMSVIFVSKVPSVEKEGFLNMQRGNGTGKRFSVLEQSRFERDVIEILDAIIGKKVEFQWQVYIKL